MRVRTVKTSSGKHALQIVSKHKGKLTVHKHIGSYDDDTKKQALYDKARKYIQDKSGQINLLDYLSSVRFKDISITESRPLFAYWLFSQIYDKIGFSSYPDEIIRDLVIARLYYPASKLETQEILADLFGRTYSLKTIYRHLKKSTESGVKDYFQKALIKFARGELKDDLKLVFYDVTTLYFESHLKSSLKDLGFSKDYRLQDVQIVVGIVVTRKGFPLYFDLFTGNTFEGHTFIATVENIQRLLEVLKLVVVADSAMLSRDNMDSLAAKNIGFIVGARVASLPMAAIKKISRRLSGKDGKITTVSYGSYRLICQYSSLRARKDKFERDKQLKRANDVIENPSRAIRTLRFIKKTGQKYKINKELIVKAKMLDGIKGYITNTNLKNQTIIDRYHDLWNIEKSIKITKSDLAARPIFHYLEDAIKAHMIIVFAALAIIKYIEIKSSLSIRRVLKLCSKVLTHKVKNNKTGETAYLETTIEDFNLKKKIELLRALGH